MFIFLVFVSMVYYQIIYVHRPSSKPGKTNQTKPNTTIFVSYKQKQELSPQGIEYVRVCKKRNKLQTVPKNTSNAPTGHKIEPHQNTHHI